MSDLARATAINAFKEGNHARLAAHSHRDAVKAFVQGWRQLAMHHQHMAAEHAIVARAHRFAIIAGRAAPDWEDWTT